MPTAGMEVEERLVVGGAVSPGWRAAFAGTALLAWGPSVVLFMSFSIFWPSLARDFGWRIGEISIGATIFSLTLVLVSPLQGWLVDRFTARRMLLVSLPLFALGLFALSRIGNDLPVYYAMCALLPALGFGLWPLAPLRMASTWFDRRLGLALGVVNLGPGLGAALVPAVIGAVIAAYGWRAGFVTLAAILLIIILPVVGRWLHENPAMRADGVSSSAPATAGGLALRDVLRERSYWIIATSFACLGFLSSGILVHQVNILVDHGMSESSAIAFQSIFGLASICGRLVAGWLLDRIHLSRIMIALLIGGAGAALLFASPATGAVLAISTITFGLLIGAEIDVLAFSICRYYGMCAFGRVYGLTFGVFQIGAAGGVFTMGQVRDATGSYAGGLITIALLCLFTAAMFLGLGKYRFEARGHNAGPAEPADQATLVKG